MVRYAIFVTLFVIVLAGAYIAGYNNGESNTTAKLATQGREVVRYVYKKSSEIYSQPNISRDSALQLFNEGKL